MTYRRPAPPMPFNRFTQRGLPDDRPAPYARDTAASIADDARARCAAMRSAGIAARNIEALAVAIGRSVGTREEYALIELLRQLAPGHAVLRRLDRIAVELGYRCAGSDEQLHGAEEFAATAVRR